MCRTLPAGIVLRQYPKVIYPAVSSTDTPAMEETEHWRLRLLELEKASGLPLLKDMAEKMGVEPSYYTRLRYPLGKKGRKNLGLDTLRAAVRAFDLRADWFDLPLGTDLPAGCAPQSKILNPWNTADARLSTVAMDADRPAVKPGVPWPFKDTSYLRLQALLDDLDKNTRAEALRDIDSLLDVAVERWEKRAAHLRKRAS